MMKSSPPSSPPLSQSMARRMSSMHFGPTKATDHEIERCNQLMTQHRTLNNKASSVPFSIKDANPVLALICRGATTDATPGLVHALFQSGADVNFEKYKSTSLFKKLQDVDQQDVRHHILCDAVKNCSPEIFFVLAQKADETAAREALPVAIALGNTEKTSILLARGANATPLCDAFLEAVEFGPADLIEILLRNTNGACQSCRNQGLLKAIAIRSTPKAILFLEKGADPVFNNGAPVLSAVQAGLEDVAILAISAGRSNLSPALLDKVLGLAYSYKQYKALLACAHAGAKGSNANSTLVSAVSNGQTSLADNMLRYGADVATNNGAAITAAVGTRDPAMLDLVLRYRPPPEVAMQAMVETTKLRDLELAYKMIDRILTAGLRGNCVSQTLGVVLDRNLLPGDDRRRLELARLLLLKGEADINWSRGQAVVIATVSQQTNIIGLLLQCRPSVDTLEGGLKHAMSVQDSDARLHITRLLLGAGPSGSSGHLQRVATIAAAKELHLDLIEFLLPISHSPQTLVMEAFVSAVSDPKKWLTDRGLPIIQALLRRGASGQHVDNAFCEATKNCHQKAFNLLLPMVNRDALSRAFEAMTTGSTSWQSDGNLETVNSLLEAGCSGHPVNAALLSVLASYVTGDASEDLVDTLLEYADINFRHGEAANIAIRAGDVVLLQKLTEYRLNCDSLARSFATVLLTPHEEDIALAMIETILEANKASGATIDLEMSLPLNGLSSVAACISTHPQSVPLIKRVVKLGCDPDKQFLASLASGFGEEPSTALLWVLAQSDAVSAEVLKVLIKAKANVDYVAPKSKLTPLMLAAKAGRSDLVALLLKSNAIPSSRDHFDATALLYASRAGHLTSVQSLIKANAITDDGSLHEAARNLHHEVVAALLKGKHKANYPSQAKEHNGRTALQELASRAEDRGDMLRLELTIKALADAKADPLSQHVPSGRKNSLFLALENLQPLSVTKALLKVVMWAQINDSTNVYVHNMPSGTKWYFSPTMYLTCSCFSGDPKYIEELRSILYKAQCQDRWYPEYGPSEAHELLPPAVVGVPQHIQDRNSKRLADKELREKREQEHQTKLRFMHEEAKHKGHIQDMHVAQKLQHSYRTHQVEVMNQTEKTELQHGALEVKNAIVAAGQQQIEAHKARTAIIDVTTQQASQQLKLNFQEKQNKAAIGKQKMQNLLTQEAQAAKLTSQQRSQAMKAADDRRKLLADQQAAAARLKNEKRLQQQKGQAKKKDVALKVREHNMKMEEMRAKQRLKKER
ncbi:hypothetical protein S40288_08389 [Stachybotrys chartarum IBT 40288]|nr:hypothetical protein S40288_08389 [Stachybotrys chartarum IBT 40288]